jgi:DNA-directed RNA polymerase omega subunit
VAETNVKNRFEFVVVAGARARQLMKGAVPRVEASEKAVTTAQREVLAGEVQKVNEETTAPAPDLPS